MNFNATVYYVSSSETNRITASGDKYTRRVALVVDDTGENLELPISLEVYQACRSLSMGDLADISIDLQRTLKGTFAKIVSINPA